MEKMILSPNIRLALAINFSGYVFTEMFTKNKNLDYSDSFLNKDKNTPFTLKVLNNEIKMVKMTNIF